MRWSRLEPRARDRTLAPGLEARIFDPLWLLARQWQFGELTADTGLGAAVTAELTAEMRPLTSYRPGPPGDGASPVSYDPAALPLEVLVEAEGVGPLAASPTAWVRARSGLHFERVLAAHGMERYAPAYRDAYALSPLETADDTSRRFSAVMARRVPDGSRLYADLSATLHPENGGPPVLPGTPPIAPADRSEVTAAAEEWLAWFDALVVEPPGGRSAWVGDRMEYAFAVVVPGAGDADGGVVLEAEEYTDGQLDWHAFTPRAAATPPPGGPQVVGPITMVPSPVSYPGMPAPRLWEFEDADVDFGDVQAAPHDLGRMLLTEFGLVYGGDWLLVPLEVPVGSLVRVLSLEVRDTFGQTTRVGPTSALEGPLGGWRMFGLSSNGGDAPASAADALLLPPVLASGLQGANLEEVLLLRDELANLAWAVERAVEGENGRAVDRTQGGSAPSEDAAGRPPAAETFRYRLRSQVPEHWHPLLPRRLRPDDPSMTLELGAMSRTLPDGTVQPIPPLGQLLRPPAPGGDVILREEEVPREGARVTRAYQLARWHDGSTFLWLGRRKRIGRGEGSSGLVFDSLEAAGE